MSSGFSPIVEAVEMQQGVNLSVRRPAFDLLESHIAPVRHFEQFQMRGPSQPPQPYAGFSVVTYVLPTSLGALCLRNSMGTEARLSPGSLAWSEAGRGLIQTESLADRAQPVDGIRLFVNHSAQHKHQAPRTWIVTPSAIPELTLPQSYRVHALSDGMQNVSAIESNQFDQTKQRVKPSDAFDFFEVFVDKAWSYTLPKGWNVMLYVMSGQLSVIDGNAIIDMKAFNTVGIHGRGTVLKFIATEPTHLFLMSGLDTHDPVFVYGPFIMNSAQELDDAYVRYRTGEMGRLEPK